MKLSNVSSVTTVGLSSPSCSGFETVSTSLNDGELSGLETLAVLVESSCSLGFASASFHSPDSVSRFSFHELVSCAKATATERTFSTLKKSLLSHCSGLGSILDKASEMTATLSELPLTLTYRPSG